MTSLMDFGAARHGFESALVVTSSVVNEDGGLGAVHATPRAKLFHKKRCRATDDAMIGNMKAHIYNHASLESIKDEFREEDRGDSDDDTPSKTENLSTISRPFAAASRAVTPTGSVSDSSYSSTISAIKREMDTKIKLIGGFLSTGKNFPWKTFLKTIAKQGFIIRNWPHLVAFPGDEPRAAAKSKGINDLHQDEQVALVTFSLYLFTRSTNTTSW
ncbi:hypothetical protein BV22DRAFT_1134899 [Leucogyrophana mollusca]|uniref:Uncharacterized protein n=1 Tax=Leucogyrophana mollusca TaxID=85980 RepID=A0ACB8AXS0_9AGAM|nr:hypothetical protein BV22DRAFT_1134899 [Leucogyrophana mollusca]